MTHHCRQFSFWCIKWTLFVLYRKERVCMINISINWSCMLYFLVYAEKNSQTLKMFESNLEKWWLIKLQNSVLKRQWTCKPYIWSRRLPKIIYSFNLVWRKIHSVFLSWKWSVPWTHLYKSWTVIGASERPSSLHIHKTLVIPERWKTVR